MPTEQIFRVRARLRQLGQKIDFLEKKMNEQQTTDFLAVSDAGLKDFEELLDETYSKVNRLAESAELEPGKQRKVMASIMHDVSVLMSLAKKRYKVYPEFGSIYSKRHFFDNYSSLQVVISFNQNGTISISHDPSFDKFYLNSIIELCKKSGVRVSEVKKYALFS
jgi:hypothetical protein